MNTPQDNVSTCNSASAPDTILKHRLVVTCMAVSLLLGLTGPVPGNTYESVSPGTWPQWRGPQRDGTIEMLPWPDRLDETHLKLMWRDEVGPRYSGPIVSENLVFTVETEDKKREIVRAFDRTTGEQMWETVWKGAMKVPFFAARNGSWVRSTPAYDGENLYVAGMRDVLTCLAGDDGMVKWRVDFVESFGTPVPDFGLVCSPLIVDGAVYVQAGGGLVKLDKATGKVQWRSLKDGGGMYGSAFSSPIMHKLGGSSQLLVQTRNLLAGVAPHNGEVLWQQPIKAFRGMNILTPVAFGDTIFTSSYGGYSLLYDCEYTDNRFALSEVWRDKKSQGYMSTPVVIDGHIYLLRRDRRFSCINPQAMEIAWVSKARFGQYWSLAANGTRILALDQKGELLLIEANPEAFRLLDRRKIAKQDTWAHVAVAGDQVYVRELKAIAAYHWHAPVVAAQQ
jgi:outer membrane protein assembly factor BamB